MIHKIGIKALGLLGIISILLTGLIIPPIAPLSSLAVLSFIAVAALLSTKNISNNRISKPILTIITLISGLAAISCAHLDISETGYLIASAGALYIGHLYSPTPSKSILITKGAPLIMLMVALFYALFNKSEQATLTSNFAGSMLLVTAPLWYALSDPKPTVSKFWLFVILLVLPSFTRSIILGIVIGLIFVHFSIKSKFKLALSASFLLAAALGYYKYHDEISNLYQGLELLTYTGKNLDTGRGDMWKGIINSMSASDIILGGFELSKVPELTSPDGKTLSAHNGYLSILSSNGILGVIFAIALPITIIKTTYIKSSQTAKILAVYTVIFFTRELFEVSLHANNFPIAGTFWFGVGILIKLISTEKPNQFI